MLLKRYLVLSAGILLFIFGYIGYFYWVNAQTEDRFRQERVKYGVDGTILTASTPSASTPAPATADATPVSSTPPTSATPADTASPGTTTDTNILIGPVPPQSSSPAPTAAPVDSNSVPMPPSSTMYFPRESSSPFLVLASYRPSEGLKIQSPGFEPPRGSLVTPPAPPVTGASTNTITASPETTNSAASVPPATISTPSTNGSASVVAPTSSSPARPSAVEASVIVLLYHQFVPAGVAVSPKFQWTLNQDTFEAEMKYLHDNGYHVVSMADLLRFMKHEIGLPPGSVVITIDDGYKSAIVYAAPILKKYGYPWTYFVYPDFITVNEGSGAASWNDLLALQADGIDIESHSMTHPQLPKHSQKIKGVWHSLSPEEYDQWLTNETLGSKTLLEQKLGKPVTCFAYPYGAYNKQVEAKTIAAGYQAIFTVADNPVHSSTSMYSIGRYTITRAVEKNFAAYLRQGALGIAEADPAPGATISNPRPVITAVLGYPGVLDPNSIETDVRDYGSVKHDFDPKTSTVRLYLPRDLIQPINLVNIRVKDAQSGQVLVANWHFNYEPAGAAANAVHPPITTSTNAAPVAPVTAPEKLVTPTATNTAPVTNAPAASVPAPAVQGSKSGH